MAVNLQMLQDPNSPYVLVAPPRNIGGRVVHKYVCNLNGNQARIAAAVDVIYRLLADNANLCPTFEIDVQQLTAAVAQDIYLTINGQAVSLARDREANGNANQYRDRYFSETMVEEPVRCPRNHLFERRRAILWVNRMGHNCPVGNDHPIGDLAIDADLQEDVARYRAHLAEEQQRAQEAIDRNGLLVLNNRTMNLQNQAARQMQVVTAVTVGGAVGKIAIKSSEGLVVKIVGKYLGKEATKTAGKVMAKGIPIFSIIAGAGFCVVRLKEGQILRALGEVASGIAACAPGVGTAISISLDAAMACYDLYEAATVTPLEAVAAAEPDLNDAYLHLGIDIEENPNPPRELVVDQYRLHAGLIHPDRAAQLGDYNRERLDEMMAGLNRCRDLIFRRRGWV